MPTTGGTDPMTEDRDAPLHDDTMRAGQSVDNRAEDLAHSAGLVGALWDASGLPTADAGRHHRTAGAGRGPGSSSACPRRQEPSCC